MTKIHSSLRYHNKHSKFMKNSHNYSNLAQSHILFYMHQRPMVPDHDIQYKENPSGHHGGMCEDGHTDRLMDGRTDALMDWTLSYIP